MPDQDIILDERGYLIPVSRQVDSNSNTNISGTETSTQSKSDSETGNRIERVGVNQDLLNEEIARTKVDLPNRDSYVFGNNQKFFEDMLRRERENNALLKQKNLDQQQIEDRRRKYQAWTNALNSLGNIAGMGYAPIAKQDNSQYLAAMNKLDALRREGDMIDAEQNLNWLKKKQTDAAIQDAKLNKEGQLQYNRDYNSALRTNADNIARAYGNAKEKIVETQKDKSSITNTKKDINRDIVNAKHLDERRDTSASGAGKPIFILGTNSSNNPNDYGMNASELEAVYNRINDAMWNYKEQKKSGSAPDNIVIELDKDNYITVPKEVFDPIVKSIDSLMSSITSGEVTTEQKFSEIFKIIENVDYNSNYGLNKYFNDLRRRQMEEAERERQVASKQNGQQVGVNPDELDEFGAIKK